MRADDLTQPSPEDLAAAELQDEILRLGAKGNPEQGEARYREQAPFLRDVAALTAAGAVIGCWEQAGQCERGALFLQEFITQRPNAINALMPAETHVAFHNSVGTLFRGQGRLEEADAEFRWAAERIGEVRDPVRWRFIVLSNAALTLKDMHAHRAAIELLEILLGVELPAARRAAALAEIAINRNELGDTETSLGLARQALDLVDASDASVDGLRQRVLHAAASISRDANDWPLALRAFRELTERARRNGDLPAEAAALVGLADAARRSGDDTWRSIASDAAERLVAARARPRTGDGQAESLVAVQAQLLLLLEDVDGLAGLIRDTSFTSMTALQAMIHLRLARGEPGQAGGELQAAWLIALGEVFGRDVPLVSDVERLRKFRRLRASAAAYAFDRFDRGIDDQLVLLTAAELQSSLLAGYLAWPGGERESPARVLDPDWLLDQVRDVTLVFAVQGSRDVRVVLERRGREEVLVEWDGFELDAARHEVEAATSRGLPRGNPLGKSARWNAFADTLGAALGRRIDAGEHVVFSLGYVLDGLPLHTVPTPAGPLGLTASCSYIASVYQLAGIRARTRHTPRWPSRGGVVSVWRKRDKEIARAAFENGAAEFSGLLRGHGIDTTTLTGVEGTVDAVGDLLSHTDIMFLSCHGIGGSGGRHAFLLAGAGQLPPMLIRPAPSPHAPRFLLNWDEMPLHTAPIVISAACSSSSGSMSRGGERVSLDRALFASGTRTFIGPLWDVSVADSTAFAVDITRHFLQGSTWADAWRQAINNCASTTAPASWQSFVLIGDWR